MTQWLIRITKGRELEKYEAKIVDGTEIFKKKLSLLAAAPFCSSFSCVFSLFGINCLRIGTSFQFCDAYVSLSRKYLALHRHRTTELVSL